MQNSKLKIWLILFLSILLSCNNDEEVKPTATDLLTDKKWIYKDLLFNEGKGGHAEAYVLYSSIEFEFDKEGNYIVTTYDQPTQGVWEWSAFEDALIFESDDPQEIFSVKVKNLTETRLVLSWIETINTSEDSFQGELVLTLGIE